MKRIVASVAIVMGLFMAALVPLHQVEGRVRVSEGAGVVDRAPEVRQVLAESRDPQVVKSRLAERSIWFVGMRQAQVTFAKQGDQVVVAKTVRQTAGSDAQVTRQEESGSGGPSIMAGEKADFTMTMWLYEWRNRDGTYTEQAALTGAWSSTEYSWLDDPVDVIDVRWIVGDLAYLSSTPYDGVQRDQTAQGIASYTVNDQIRTWDLYVNFRPTSSDVYGKWTNIFANYHHTWMGMRLSIQLQAGATGGTGNLTLNTEARTWVEGLGLAIQIGSESARGPVTSSVPVTQ
ncbi:MAG TPA: hypothetical protein VK191_14630 [Symbiobacteriaceae bacterium]|nr:hypothetical protein [Symbiobacteriaceae bacterium]